MTEIPENLFIHMDELNHSLYEPVPFDLIKAEEYRTLSAEAKLLYGLLLNRVYISRNNDMADSKRRIFVYFTIEG